MRALTWQGRENVAVTEVPDPIIKEPTDAIIKVTSTAICGSDLHLYSMLSPFLSEGDVLGHETMGIVQEVGSEVTHISPGDRVVVPFTISCGHCWMCDRGLFSQCETTQNREHDCGASLFGSSRPRKSRVARRWIPARSMRCSPSTWKRPGKLALPGLFDLVGVA